LSFSFNDATQRDRKAGFAGPSEGRRPSVSRALVAALVATLGSHALADGPASHPMDPLTAPEYSAVIGVLSEEDRVDGASRYPLTTLAEPAKSFLLQWKPGDPVPRQAFVVVKKGSRTFEAVVDIVGRKVISWEEIPGVQPGVLLTEEWDSAQRIVQAHPGWQAAVRKRGIEDLRDIVCIPHTVGYYGLAQEEGHRLAKVVCFQSAGTRNFWARPIEGLIAVVDHDKQELVKLIDTGVVPIPESGADLDEDSVGKLRRPPNPISIAQPHGHSFVLDGHVVRWQKWQFHFRIDPRLGLVISTVLYDDGGQSRSILYQGSLSELFVPYMDPDIGWYFKTYMDAGEYGVGKLAAELQPGLDCPPTAVMFDAVFADDWGDPYTQKRSACLFERYAGDVAWRHYEAVNLQTEVRKRTDLVLRSVSAIGNYDYIFDWVFRQDGTIRVAVGASGVEQVKAVRSATIKEDKDGSDTAYGHMVARHTVAINHDHFFCFRIDLDIDGQKNSFLHERLRTRRLGQASPRSSVWVVEASSPATEQEARLRIDLRRPALWRVVNPNVVGPLGYPVSYELRPGANAVSLLAPDDFPQRRAGFTDFHLWVTPYDARERYAAGMYPNQSKGGDGLPRWTSANRSIQNTDLVVWYTLGFHHVVRAEDWPVLPTAWREFELRPFDFFRRNPALDLPE